MRRIVVLCLTLLLVAACGGGGNETSTSGSGATAPTGTSAVSTTTTVATATSATATSNATPVTQMTATPNASPSTGSTGAGLPSTDQLKTALLVLADLPAGWSVTTGDTTMDTSDNSSCGETATPTTTDKVTVGVDFQETELGPFLSESITVLPDGQAQAAFDLLKKSLSCTQWTETDSEGTPTSYQMNQLSIPKMGDDSVAVHLTGTTSGFTFQADTVFVRVGNYTVSVANVALDKVDSDLTASITQKAVERVQTFTQ